MVYEEIVIPLLGAVASSGLLVASLTYVFDKRKQIKLGEQKEKEKRYKAMVLHMRTIVKPDDLKYLQQTDPI